MLPLPRIILRLADGLFGGIEQEPEVWTLPAQVVDRGSGAGR